MNGMKVLLGHKKIFAIVHGLFIFLLYYIIIH